MSNIKFKKTINDILPEDYKFINKEPDKDFSPARNKAIMEECIRNTDKYFATLHQLDNETKNRIDIVATYGTKRLGGATQKSFREYVGRELFNELVGEKIMSKVRIADTVNRFNKNNNFILN